MACADRTCSEVYSCMLAVPGFSPGTVLTISGSGALAWGLASGGTAGNLTTTTTGLIIGNGTGATLTNATINYNLTSGIASLNTGLQGVLGGTGTSNTYVGGDGLLHLLPVAASGSGALFSTTSLTNALTISGGGSTVSTQPMQLSIANYVGTNGIIAGTPGLVPAATTADEGKFLNGAGVWSPVYTSWSASFGYGTVTAGRYPNYGVSGSPLQEKYFTNDLASPLTKSIIVKMFVQQHGTSLIATTYRLVNLTTATTLATVNVPVGANTNGSSTGLSVLVSAQDKLYWEVVTGDVNVGAEVIVEKYDAL